MQFRKLKKLLAKNYDIRWDPTQGKGSHGVFVGLTHRSGITAVYTVPADQQKEINSIYLKPLRRKFELTSEHGVSDDLFDGCGS